MCQAVRDGGRRCPVHRHDSNAVITLAAGASGLSRRQTERLFSELRREGRHARRMSAAQRERFLGSVRVGAADNPDILTSVNSQITRSLAYETEVPDGATGYAQRLLVERAKTRGEALNQKFQDIATRTGLSVREIETKFDEYVDEVDTRRGQTTQSEHYNQNTRRRAVLANLPYDRASVIAYGRLEELVQPEPVRRVTLIQNPNETSHIQAYGYDETDGRFEITFRANPDTIYAYRNVPPNVWEDLANSSSPGTIYARRIRGNEDYQYGTREEAESEAYRTRCASCGQFANPGYHTCPASAYRAEASADPTVTVAEIQETVAQINTPTETDTPPAQENSEEPVTVDTTSSAPAPVEEEEPAPRRRRGRRAAAETETPPADPETPTTPLPDIPAVWNAGTERVPSDPDAVRGGGSVTRLPLPELPERAVTEENQRQPTAFDNNQLQVNLYNTGLHSRYAIRTGGTGLSFSLENTTMTPEQLEEFNAAPDHLRFIFGLNRDNKYELLDTYDDRIYSASTGYASRYSNPEYLNPEAGSAYGQPYVVIRRRGYYPNLQQLTPGEHATQLGEENQKWDALIQSGEVVKVAANTTSTRSYIMDANFRSSSGRRRGSYSQPAIQLGRVAQVRAALRNNKAFAVPVSLDYSGTTLPVVDDQGYEVGNLGHSSVTGEMVFRRNSDGVIEVLSSPRKLACTCAKYREYYHCEHVDHVQRHMGNVIQQQVPVENLTSPRARSVHRLLPANILSRGDATVVERENDEPYLSFGSTLPDTYRQRSNWSRWEIESNRAYTAPLITISDPPTMEERAALFEWSNNALIDRLDTVRNMGAVRQALRRSDVEIPVSLHYRSYLDMNTNTRQSAPNVTGTITYKRITGDSYEELPVRAHTLRCTCADYRADYDCIHVRETLLQSFAILHAGRSPREGVTRDVRTFRRDHDALITEETEIRYAMLQRELSREEAEIWVADAELRRQTERAEAEARRQEQLRQRAQAEAERIEREARELAEQNAPTIEATQKHIQERIAAWESTDPGYMENPDKLHEDITAALSRKRKGQPAIPFRTTDVTDGICAPVEGARRFGVELEFDIQNGVDRTTALRKIGQELKEAGLTRDSRQTGYHTARSSGWHDWSFEQDCTVAGELVSPILSDTPEHWEQLRKACEIITRNGGVATTRTGSHVHISSASYGISTAKHAEVLRTVAQNEDIMYRLASNPATGRHRGTQWCAPNVAVPNDDVDETVAASHRVLGYHTDHGHAVNFEGSGSTRFASNQIEYRMWDATLDPAVIQQQVALSAAITDYAERNVIKNKGSKKPTEPAAVIGTHKQKEAAIPETVDVKEKSKQVNQKVAAFFDQLFRRSEDREAAAALFAITKWQ